MVAILIKSHYVPSVMPGPHTCSTLNYQKHTLLKESINVLIFFMFVCCVTFFICPGGRCESQEKDFLYDVGI